MTHKEQLLLLRMEHRGAGPAFRWRLAQRYACLPRHGWPRFLDEPTGQAAAYLRLCDQADQEQARRQYPSVAAASALFDDAQGFRVFRLSHLGALSPMEIAARLGVKVETVAMIEDLFFDIRGMRGATSWLGWHVFLPEVKAGDSDLASQLQRAFSGGCLAARTLLDAGNDLPLELSQILSP
jgi:hypothetical protein